MITTILITIWITCGVIYIAKESANHYARDFLPLSFIFGIWLILQDIIDEWREWNNIRSEKK